MPAHLKGARGILDQQNQRWCLDNPPGQPHLSCLERSYQNKLAFFVGMDLVPECGTETCVLFLVNMYELADILVTYTWGQVHPEFFQKMDAVIVKKVLHSTKIPAGLSLRTFATVSQDFWQAHPTDELWVIVVGVGCGVEGEKMMQERPEGCRLTIRKVDILGWVPGGDVQVLDPREKWLDPSMPLRGWWLRQFQCLDLVCARLLGLSIKFFRH
jgi:hypothetical protein